jgi:DNA-binding response OmpR family regulator
MVKIYCVDDDALSRELLRDIFVDQGHMLEEHELILFSGGEECLAALAEQPPDLVLLDVMMPGLDGIETCRRLRASEGMQDVPVIFISGSDSLENRVEAYAAGGDDFLTKPVMEPELLAKVSSALKRKIMIDEARESLESAQTSINDIMAIMGEMGVVVNFFQTSFTCRSFDVLAKRIIQAHEVLGLEIAIELVVDGERSHYSSNGIDIPLESSVFEFVRSKGRLVNCGQRAAVNFPGVSIIVRNMPSDDPDRYGRIRDHIALIGEAADAKLNALQSELQMRDQRQQLLGLVGSIEEALRQIDLEYTAQKHRSERIFEGMLDELEDSFMTLGLSEEQEDYQRRLIEVAQARTTELYQSGLALEVHFASIRERIQKALESTGLAEEEAPPPAEDDGEGDAVTLF